MTIRVLIFLVGFLIFGVPQADARTLAEARTFCGSSVSRGRVSSYREIFDASAMHLNSSEMNRVRHMIRQRYEASLSSRHLSGDGERAFRSSDVRPSVSRSGLLDNRYRLVNRAVRAVANDLIRNHGTNSETLVAWANQARRRSWPISNYFSCVARRAHAPPVEPAEVNDSQGYEQLVDAVRSCQIYAQENDSSNLVGRMVNLYQILRLDYCGSGIKAQQRRREYRDRERTAGRTPMARPIPSCAQVAPDPGSSVSVREFRVREGGRLRTIVFRDSAGIGGRRSAATQGSPGTQPFYQGPERASTPQSNPVQRWYYQERVAIRRLLTGAAFPPGARAAEPVDSSDPMTNCREIARADDWHVLNGTRRARYANCLTQMIPQAEANLRELVSSISRSAESSPARSMVASAELTLQDREATRRCIEIDERVRTACASGGSRTAAPQPAQAQSLVSDLNRILSQVDTARQQIETSDPSAALQRLCQAPPRAIGDDLEGLVDSDTPGPGTTPRRQRAREAQTGT